MVWSIVAVVVGACTLGLVASLVIAWASNRSAAWNMMFGAACGLAILLAALVVAFLLTRAAFPY